MIIFSSIKKRQNYGIVSTPREDFSPQTNMITNGFFFSYQTGQTPVKWSHYTLTLNQSQFSVRWGILDAEMEDGHL